MLLKKMNLVTTLGAFTIAAAMIAPVSMAQDDSAKASKPSEKAEKVDPLKEMKDEISRLSTEYQLQSQRQKNELAKMELEKQRLAAEASLAKAQHDAELAEMKNMLARLQAEAQLASAKQQQELASAKAEIETINTMTSLHDKRLSESMRETNEELKRLMTENSLLAQKVKHHQTVAAETSARFAAEMAEAQGQLSSREMRDKVKAKVVKDIEYRMNPLDGNTLYVTDRRIPLNGAIYSGTADFVNDRINYFNNQSTELPIFIVIDNCPGGSVMEGYRIVKAIQESPAPIHVVVKSFAASMAAVITTLADHSYAYPNAIILHHQMSSSMRGNLTQQAESLENGFEWSRRLADPVAEKMGVSPERFVELMYENNSDGDWEEFADVAIDLKWVNNVVQEIREEGILSQPTGSRSAMFMFMKEHEEVDASGNPYIKLPRLQPFDYYFMYDPDNYYR